MAFTDEEEKKIDELLSRGIERVYPSKEEAKKILLSGKKIRVYLGIDPTGKEIHIGHSVVLLFLKRLYEAGHIPIVLMGDFTARIGDPTDKDAARKQLTAEQVRKNMATYWDQISKILDTDKVEKRHNAEWYEKMDLDNFIRLASEETVQQMLARDMFQKRMKNKKPIGVHEFLYPIMQGYDSVALDVDGEVGGKDQTFNMLVGRDFLKNHKKREKLVFATKLLEDPVSGKKMSKTEGNLVSFNDLPNEMFGKVMSFPDEMILAIFECATEVPMEHIQEIKKGMNEGENPKDYKLELAAELVRMYHGEKEAKKAREEFERVFSQKKLPEDIGEYKLKGNTDLVDVMVDSGLAKSKSEAKRLIGQGAVAINGSVEKKWDREINPGDVMKVGVRRYIRIS
ncbi:MAG: tyrosyl-tRNA synthetase [Parcubacteria group bacterium Licking1014_17]|nr:MAG: tyrosyl-tRNA synthetase [Parcubacteria group bacterium Licking1014_17]